MEVSVLPVCLPGRQSLSQTCQRPTGLGEKWLPCGVCVCVCLRVFVAGLGEGNGCPPESAQARLGHTVKYTHTKSSRASYVFIRVRIKILNPSAQQHAWSRFQATLVGCMKVPTRVTGCLAYTLGWGWDCVSSSKEMRHGRAIPEVSPCRADGPPQSRGVPRKTFIADKMLQKQWGVCLLKVYCY